MVVSSPSIELSHISIAGNRLSNIADWSCNGVLAFAAGPFIALYKPEVS